MLSYLLNENIRKKTDLIYTLIVSINENLLNLHTFFSPVLHTLDHEVGIALRMGQDGYH